MAPGAELFRVPLVSQVDFFLGLPCFLWSVQSFPLDLSKIVHFQVALRLGNYELINLLLRYGANVNYYCRINTTHFPSALQYALKDEVIPLSPQRHVASDRA